MATLEHDPQSGRYRIRFRYGMRSYKRSLKTRDEQEACGILGRVEETIRLLERGRLEIPPDSDPGTFILSDGKRTGKAVGTRVRTLDDLFKLYQEKLPAGAKEDSTLWGEKRHIRHLLRLLGGSSVVQTMKASQMQDYSARRLKETWRGRCIRSDTVKKELTTLKLVWNWAVNQGYLNVPPPLRGIKHPKRDEKPPFMTYAEISKIVQRGGLSEDEEKELWECLFLTREEVAGVLELVRGEARHRFIYPMFVFVAHTGARRSEILRSQVDDFDFGAKTVRIREKKKSRVRATTYRWVPMTGLLTDVMQDWFAHHPGGQYTICDHSQPGCPLTPSEAHSHFKRTLAGSDWKKIRGFHVFRHSFASNLAAKGIDQRIIDEWMGHQTEEMRKRYRHLFPDQQRAAIDSVFGRNGQ